MNIIHLMLIGIASSNAHEAGEMSVRVGPEQGILERSEEQGFKLSPEAIKRFKLSFIPYNGTKVTIDADSIVRTLSEIGVYRKRDGFLKRVEIQNLSRDVGKASFTSTSLKSGDEILAQGAGFVRVIESAFGKGESDEDEHKGRDDHKNEGSHENKEEHGEEGHHD